MKLTKEEKQKMIDVINKGKSENEYLIMDVETQEKQSPKGNMEFLTKGTKK